MPMLPFISFILHC